MAQGAAAAGNQPSPGAMKSRAQPAAASNDHYHAGDVERALGPLLDTESTPLLVSRPRRRSSTSSLPGGTLSRRGSNASNFDDHERDVKHHSHVLAAVLLAVCLVAFLIQSEVTSHVQNRINFKKPYFMLWFAHSFYAVLIPVQALISWARDGSLGPHLHFLRTTIQSLNTPAWLTQSTTAVATLSAAPRSRQPSFGSISAPPISRGRDHDQPCWMVSFAVRTLLLAFLSALPSYLWYMAAGLTTMGNLTAIYNTSAFWAYAFSIWFCVAGERFAWTKISAVFVSLIGVACISLLDPPESDAQPQASAMDLGNLVALAGAVAYGLYEALYKKYAVPAQPSVAFANFFTGCIGVFTVLVLWIPIPILHVLGVEPFEVPTATQLGFLCIVALMGLAFNACFMLLIAFTSPVMAAVGIMLTIPCIAVTDLAIGTVAFIPWNSVLGSSLICLGFLVLASRD